MQMHTILIILLVKSVVRELRSVIHLHITALEERKRDLLQKVNTIRQAKLTSLKLQGERINQRLFSLKEALKVLFIFFKNLCFS